LIYNYLFINFLIIIPSKSSKFFIFVIVEIVLNMSAAHPLSNLQQELLKLYSSDIPEADLLHIKRYLAKYFAFKAIGEADQIWDEKGYTNETMNQWVNEDRATYGTKDSD